MLEEGRGSVPCTMNESGPFATVFLTSPRRGSPLLGRSRLTGDAGSGGPFGVRFSIGCVGLYFTFCFILNGAIPETN